MIYAAFYRDRPRTSIFDCARVEAETMKEAIAFAEEDIKAVHPNAQIIKVFEAHRSPWGAKNADGKMCPAELVY